MDDLITFLRARLAEREADYSKGLKDYDLDSVNGDESWIFAECQRGLRDVEAKQAILDEFSAATAFSLLPDTPGGGYASALATVARLLALPYVDHPEYRAEWTP